MPLIGVGGILRGADAYAKVRAGASALQLYTALVYRGPRVVSRIRIPPEQVFELAKALTQQLEFWEQETGRRNPGGPLLDD